MFVVVIKRAKYTAYQCPEGWFSSDINDAKFFDTKDDAQRRADDYTGAEVEEVNEDWEFIYHHA